MCSLIIVKGYFTNIISYYLETCTSNNMFICALDPNDRKCELTCIPRDQECDGNPQCPMKDDEHCRKSILK